MRSYSLFAPAKINLYLEIVGDYPSSDNPASRYHELVMVLQSIELADQVDVRPIGTERIVIHCDNPHVPNDNRNLAYRAAELMIRQFPDCFAQYGGVEITLHKRIPVEAGLAGGSTDAAAVLVGIDLMWNLGLTQSELQELGAMLGSDVPFCIAGGTALATGRGEKLDPLPDLDHLYVVLAKYRSVAVSTAWAYKAYRQQFGHTYVAGADSEQRRHKPNSGSMLTAIGQRDGAQIGQRLHNDLEKVVLPEFPKIAHLRDQFHQLGVLGTMMSGSGSAVFALIESPTQAEQVYQQMKTAIPDPDLELWVTKFRNTGIRLTSTV
jgi:4-diphosphocytidyl-2-C-methyl-D-erythritol kinase